jgi:MerR family transcriptional regulator, redox-sensitive transcriptional activator SoxR
MARGGLAIGDLADRTGLSVPAIRHYEVVGILAPLRNTGGHRRYDRSDIRRLSFAIIAQGLGIPLARIALALKALPEGRTPTRADWTTLSLTFRDEIDGRIARLTSLRDRLDGCIGCGCLSLDTCRLYNPDDRANRHGQGPRYLLGDRADPLPAGSG